METALYPRLVGRVRFRAASRRPGSHNRSIRDATRLYLRAAKEAHEFTVNVLSEKFRRASRLMNYANYDRPFVDDPADHDPRRPQATGSLF